MISISIAPFIKAHLIRDDGGLDHLLTIVSLQIHLLLPTMIQLLSSRSTSRRLISCWVNTSCWLWLIFLHHIVLNRLVVLLLIRFNFWTFNVYLLGVGFEDRFVDVKIHGGLCLERGVVASHHVGCMFRSCLVMITVHDDTSDRDFKIH